ncbi:MAG TPA: hypothetical protein VNT22_04960 [Baekduia sp.]|nr:hypothetical protein [Baekduia sp.]
MPTPSIVIAAVALFIALGGSAVAASKLIKTRDIATGAVTSAKVKDGTIALRDLSANTRQSLGDGTSGVNGANGANGPNGANGANGVDGDDGAAGNNGSDGSDGVDGADGVLAPLSVAVTSVAIPTSASRTVVATLAVPAGNYVVFAKTQLSHTGAGDSVDCFLRAGSTDIDQVSMKTHPALAAVPATLQAVTTTSPIQLSLECKVLVANGSADFTKLIALPIG